MNCIRCEELISEYLEGGLNASESHAFEVHLAGCPSCSELVAGVRDVMAWGRVISVQEPPAWLATRIVANTPQLIHETWLDTLVGVWRWLTEPRIAMAIFTATIVIGWLGSLAGLNVRVSDIQDPAAIYYRAEGYLNRAYGQAVQRYTTPILAQIQFQIERLREIS